MIDDAIAALRQSGFTSPEAARAARDAAASLRAAPPRPPPTLVALVTAPLRASRPPGKG